MNPTGLGAYLRPAQPPVRQLGQLSDSDGAPVDIVEQPSRIVNTVSRE